MLGFLYILLNVFTGFVICSLVFPKAASFARRTYSGEKIASTSILICIPLWYVLGAFLMTWTTYFAAYLAAMCGAKEPLGVADAIVFLLFAAIDGLGAYRLYKTKRLRRVGAYINQTNPGELVFMGITLVFAFFLMWWTFSYQNGVYRVGYSVFSDFAPHLGMIRSFSKGNNFPTTYSHFAGEDIKYHFMFQFMVGNLEYLGMRLDWAFNLPSALCFAFAFWLLYVLAVKLTGKRAVGYVAAALFAFRSSDAVFDFFTRPTRATLKLADPDLWKQLGGGTDGVLNRDILGMVDPKKISRALQTQFRDGSEFIGTTTHEDWGLWNLNVYCNQRHLAIGLCALLILVLFLLPLVFSAVDRVRFRMTEKRLLMRAEDPEYQMFPIEKIGYTLRYALLTKEGWLPESYVRPVLLGLLLGMCSFFNGACVIGCLCVLFLLAVVADHRLEYAVTAFITVACTMGATKFFIDGSVVDVKYYPGFLADLRTFAGSWDYIMTLCGILPFILLAAFLLADGTRKWIWVAFAAPFIFAFTVSLTIDITVNHKYIMMSLMLLAVPAAHFLVWLFERAGGWPKIVACALLFALTITGIYDLRTVIRKNDIKQGRFLTLSEDDPVTEWISENATSQDIFLSPYYSLNNVVMGGAMLYYGWPYYAWSAGYDTPTRDRKVKEMYESSTSEELITQVRENNIRFIIVDRDARTSTEYKVNEAVISMTFEPVYNDGSTIIYDTTKFLQYTIPDIEYNNDGEALQGTEE